MKSSNSSYELNILVGGKPITEYTSNGAIFVEGRKGSEFELEFKNPSYKRVLVIPAVDGRSVLDGKPATPASKGYIVPAYGSIRIPGWTLNAGAVAKFVFEDKEKSYAAQTTSTQSAQTGVVGVIVFDEHIPIPVSKGFTSSANTITLNIPYGMNTKLGTRSANNVWTDSPMLASTSNAIPTNPAPIEDAFNMGTGFGQKADFKTNEVTFNKGNQVAQLVLYYDSRRNLEKRGIHVASRETRYVSDLPPAFSSGCVPPLGWNG